MWPAEPSNAGELILSLGTRRIDAGVLRQGRWVSACLWSRAVDPLEGLVHPVGAATAALRLLQADITAAPRDVKRLRVVVNEAWLALDAIAWGEALMSEPQASDFARQQLAQAGFQPQLTDTVRLDDAVHGQPRLAVAYPAELLLALRSLADALGAVLVSVLPQSVAAWAWAGPRRRDSPALLLVHDDAVTLVTGASRAEEVHTWPLESGPVARRDAGETGPGASADSEDSTDSTRRAAQVGQVWRRHQRRQGLVDDGRAAGVLDLAPEPGAVNWPKGLRALSLAATETGGGTGHDAQVPATLRLAWAARQTPSPLDALPVLPRRAGAWRLAAGLAALLVLGLAIQSTPLRRQLAQAQALAAQSRPEPADAAVQVPAWSREEVAQARAVNAAIRELNLPLSALMATLQPPADLRVLVLGVDMNTAPAAGDSTSVVRVTAEARTGSEMARYVAYLGEKRPFVGALLLRHEVDEQSPARPYRFTLEASWQP